MCPIRNLRYNDELPSSKTAFPYCTLGIDKPTKKEYNSIVRACSSIEVWRNGSALAWERVTGSEFNRERKRQKALHLLTF